LAIHDRNRRLGKLWRGQAQASHGAAIMTTPDDPIFPCRLNLDERPRSHADSGQYRSTKSASAYFHERPPCFPHILPTVLEQSQNPIFIYFYSENQIHLFAELLSRAYSLRAFFVLDPILGLFTFM
jgi:hypothetical protein